MQRNNFSLIIPGHFLNSLSTKFDILLKGIKENVDLLVTSEAKLDDTFLKGQSRIPGFFSPFQEDENQYGGAIFVFIKEDILAKLLFTESETIVFWRLFLNN